MRRARATVNQTALTRRFGNTGSPLSLTPEVFLTGYDYTNGSSTWPDRSTRSQVVSCYGISAAGAKKTVNFNGSTEWQMASLGLNNSWTVISWACVTAWPNNACIFAQKYNNNSPINAALGQAAVAERSGFWNSSSGWRTASADLGVINGDGKVHSYACSWDGTSLKQYKDGVLVSSNQPGGTALPSSSNMVIGGMWDGYGVGGNITGRVGEIRVYKTVPTDTQILDDYNYTTAVRPYN